MIPITITEFERRRTIKFVGGTIGNLEEIFEGVAWEDHPGIHGQIWCHSTRRTVAIVRPVDSVLHESEGGMHGPVRVLDKVGCMSTMHRVTIDRHEESLFDKLPIRYRTYDIVVPYCRNPHKQILLPV